MKDRLAAIAADAGRAILPFFRADAGLRTKSDGSPVTAADLAAEAVILRALAAVFPDIPVVSEEAASCGRVPPASDRFFLVDPLDGTREFIAGRPEFTVNIGLVADGAPVAGVVLAPVTGRLFVADADGAETATLADGLDPATPRRPIRVSPPPAGPLRVVASRSHRTAETDTLLARLPGASIHPAGSSLKFCLLAAGEADLYPRHGPTMEWDTAAADAVLRAAGGTVLTLDGRPLGYGKRSRADVPDFLNPFFVAASGPATAAVALS